MLAGVAKVEITTHARNARIKDPFYAKGLVLSNGRTQVATITMDVIVLGAREISQGMLPDVGEELLPKLRRPIQKEKELHIPAAYVLVNASHTHPPGRLLCSDEQQVARTFDAGVPRATRPIRMHLRVGG